MPEPNLDIWGSLFLLAAAQGYFLSAMIFIRKSKANMLLGFVILGFSLYLTFVVAFWTKYIIYLPAQVAIVQALPYTFGPLIYFYLRSDDKKLFFNPWHFIPFIVDVCLFIFPIPWMYIGLVLISAQIIHLTFYSIRIFIWFRSGESNLEKRSKRYRWIKKTSWAFLIYVTLFASNYFLFWTGNLRGIQEYIIPFSFSFFIYSIGYSIIQKPSILRMNENTKYTSSNLSASASEAIMGKIRRAMHTEKLYLKPSLKLEDLASLLNLQKHHISQSINELEQTNFSDYLNTLRIEEAKEILQNTDEKIIQVAYRSGFNNKVSFNTKFKKVTGLSPKEFRAGKLKS